jgi:peptidoglycan/LPS O-acetylase OafA/YrhL
MLFFSNKALINRNGYRPEIDGLRAIALLSVIFFHAGFEKFAGGFLAVDIFFVVSGYLITSSILTEKASGTYRTTKFLERRARRLLPALFIVVLFCVPIAWLLLLPSDMKDFSQSLIAVNGFFSNILFWIESGYFDSPSQNKPLLHTWSLSLEVQYYILFPVFLLLVRGLSEHRTASLLGILAIISFILAQWGHSNMPSATFFLLPTRGWEFAVGSLIAFLSFQHIQMRTTASFSVTASFLGLFLVIYAIFTYDKSTLTLGPYISATISGTALLLLFATQATPVGKLLAAPPLVGIGLLSYGVYLWHQPLFAFYRVSALDWGNSFVYVLLAALSSGLAYISWRYVEFYFRSSFSKTSVFFAFSGLFLALFTSVGLYGSIDGFKNRFDRSTYELLDTFDRDLQTRYVVGNYNKFAQKREWDLNGRPKVLIIGDSFSQDLFNAITEVSLNNELDIILRYVPLRCGVLFIDKSSILEAVEAADSAFCSREIALAEDDWLLRNLRTAEHVWLASAWRLNDLALFDQSLVRLRSYTNAKIIVFGGKVLPKLSRNHLDYSPRERANLVIDLDRKVVIQERMFREVKGVNYIDVQNHVCSNSGYEHQWCRLFDDNGLPKSYDGGHLTKYGALFLGRSIESALRASLLSD